MKKILCILLSLGLAAAVFADVPERIQSGEKSAPLALGMSLVLPGAGQIYNGKAGLAAVFLGAEALLIGGNILMNNIGDQKISEYEAYADLHWTVENWLAVYDPATDASTHTATVYVDGVPYYPHDATSYDLMTDDMDNGYSSLSIEKDYHFYENIGKYAQFKAGWDDWVAGGEDPGDPLNGIYGSYSDNQYEYSGMRSNANVYLKAGGYMISAIIFNHLASAIQAGICAKNQNSSGTSLSVYSMPFMTAQSHTGYAACLTLSF